MNPIVKRLIDYNIKQEQKAIEDYERLIREMLMTNCSKEKVQQVIHIRDEEKEHKEELEALIKED